MPSLNRDFLKSLAGDWTNFPCFIETGTFQGETIFAMEPLFSKLYTVELAEKFYNNTRLQYAGNKINFLLGDSSDVFKTLLPTIQDRTIFFLDGHWSSGDTGKGVKDCPLVEEITHINCLFRHEAIIIIDDFRLFGLDASSGKLNEDWSDIHKDSLLHILKDRITDVYHLDSYCAKDDRLVIHISAH